MRRSKRPFFKKLSSREWKFDQPLPSESKMAEDFGVSIGSVRHAVADLEDAGILVKRQKESELLCEATKAPESGTDSRSLFAKTAVYLSLRANR